MAVAVAVAVAVAAAADRRAGRFSCAACGKCYGWKPALAGKRGRCACGRVMRIPATAPGTPAAPRPVIAASPIASRPRATPQPKPVWEVPGYDPSAYEDEDGRSPSGNWSPTADDPDVEPSAKKLARPA
jgi:hypothetical protein